MERRVLTRISTNNKMNTSTVASTDLDGFSIWPVMPILNQNAQLGYAKQPTVLVL